MSGQGLEGLPGPAGLPGLNGQSATRVPTSFPPVVATGGTAWSSFSATIGGTLRGNGDAIANAVAGNDGGPLIGDLVTIFRTVGSVTYSSSRTYTGVGWVDIQSYIHGGLLVSGSIIARHLAAHIITADHILAGSLTAGVVAANFFDGAINIRQLWTGSVNTDAGSTWRSLTGTQSAFGVTFLMFWTAKSSNHVIASAPVSFSGAATRGAEAINFEYRVVVTGGIHRTQVRQEQVVIANSLTIRALWGIYL